MLLGKSNYDNGTLKRIENRHKDFHKEMDRIQARIQSNLEQMKADDEAFKIKQAQHRKEMDNLKAEIDALLAGF